MSLFPAYGDGSRQDEAPSETSNEKMDWLSLQSYRSGTGTLSDFQPEADVEAIEEKLPDGGKHPKHEVTKEIYEHYSSSCSDDEISQKHRKKEVKKIDKKNKKKKKKKRRRTDEGCEDENLKLLKEEAFEMEVLSHCTDLSTISQLPVTDKVFVNDILPLIKTPYAFSVDRKPDKDNLSYGCIYRTKIARYRLFGNSKTGSKTRKAKKISYSSGGRYFGSRERKLAEPCDVVSILDVGSDIFSGDFVPLLTVSDCIKDASVVEVSGNKTSAIRKKVEELNRLLTADPHNERLWLEFVDFQKSTLCLKLEDNRSKDDVEQWLRADGKTLVEIKCAILEKAVEKNPSSKTLRLAQLELMESVWEMEKLSQEWKKLVFNFANDADVWRSYLGFVKHSFGVFTVSGVAGVYAKCLTTLDAIHCGTMTSHKEMPNTVENMIDIFADLCVFLYQSGHAERAAALYQAQMEYNLFCPSILLDVAAADRMDFLSAFWDSGVPRFGEVGAKGWEDWVVNNGVYSPNSMPANAWSSKDKDEKEEEELIKTHEDQDKLWLAFEDSRLSRHWLPWKQLLGSVEDDDDECEDSERIVLFEDISKYLFCVTSDEHKFALFSKFFDFLACLCELKTSVQNLSSLNAAEFASEIFRYSDANVLFPQLSNGLNLENYAMIRSNILTQVGGKFAGNYGTFIYLCEIDFRSNQIARRVDSGVTAQKKELKKFLKTLLSVERNNLAIWQRLAVSEFEGGNLKDARKVFDTAIATCCTNSVPDLLSYETCVTTLLYRTYASLELGLKVSWFDASAGFCFSKRSAVKSPTTRAGETVRPICILVALCEGSDGVSFGSAIQPTKLLKCWRLYSQTLGALLEQFNAVPERSVSELLPQLRYVGSVLVHWFSCCSMFQYVVNGFEAMSTFAEGFLSTVSLSCGFGGGTIPSVCRYKRSVHLSCVEAYTDLHCYHVSNCVSPLRPLRVHLLSSLRHFRDSRFLLESFVDLESTFSIAGRLRKFFHESVCCAPTPLIPLFAVLSEFKRMHNLKLHQTDLVQGCFVMETGVTNQLRAWFEMSVNQQTSKHCILIWRLYMFFEAQMHNHSNVKAVFYRALQQCPWAKTIYLDCVRYAPDMLQEVNDLMTEKELRVRTPLEELALLMLGKNALTSNNEINESNEQKIDSENA